MSASKKKKRIFVFGSNLAGRHGAGAALHAKQQYGAVYGVGEGRTGDAYAIPTKGLRFEILPVGLICAAVATFLQYAKDNYDELEFVMTEVGCGLARGGLSLEERRAQIAPLFRGATDNIIMPEEWKRFLCSTGPATTSSTPNMDDLSDFTTRVW